jgi:hypothetical protein
MEDDVDTLHRALGERPTLAATVLQEMAVEVVDVLGRQLGHGQVAEVVGSVPR